MKKRDAVVGFVLMITLLTNLGCQETPETGQENLAKAQKGLVDYMDEYHRVLRPLMHQALPDKNVAAFKENSAELLKCAENLAAADIPEKFETQKAKISTLTGEILENTRTFHETCQTGTEQEIFDTFLAAHDKYEALADIVYQL
ncbi:hypothetical protein GWO43_02640 [candidate division KSB1 bacterium]|nr:hypothetical protein [candidate division KSB1 bacterium]NIR69768.1 hypothetical protein [candidate division KSB1 bacterium]NIS22951.1 hypothetical protein [candidate division KSB1 bacterium]NIT69808.1 hypothetical protein [candidate division KSB1 bacterium]NIU23482.1 hypothetical protein [candidate division KSB1 bacterium]